MAYGFQINFLICNVLPGIPDSENKKSDIWMWGLQSPKPNYSFLCVAVAITHKLFWNQVAFITQTKDASAFCFPNTAEIKINSGKSVVSFDKQKPF